LNIATYLEGAFPQVTPSFKSTGYTIDHSRDI